MTFDSSENATFAGNIVTTGTKQIQFGDSGTYIHQSADGVLDLVSDTEIEINATTIDMNGILDLSGNATVGGTLGVTGVATFSTHVALGDSDILKLGADSDLQIYSTGSHAYIDNDTGNLYLDGSNIQLVNAAETMATFVKDGAVTLYHDNAAKLATASGGVAVTGT